MQKTYTYIHTPGHGYLSVSIKELKCLNLINKISSYSYMNLTRVYLEEDFDLSLFIDAKKKLNQKVNIKDSYRDVSDIVPGSNYDTQNIDNPIQLNSIVTNGKDTFTVVAINKRKIVIKNESGRYRVPISNPYKYLTVKNKNYNKRKGG